MLLRNQTLQRWIGGTFFEWLGIDVVARMEMVGLALHKDWKKLKVLRRARRERWSMVTNNEMFIVQSLAYGLIQLPGDFVEDYTDPEIIHDRFEKLVNVVIDGGIGGITPSTIIDFSRGEAELVREGAGEWVL